MLDQLLLFLFLFYQKEIREAISSPYAHSSTLGIVRAAVPVTVSPLPTPQVPPKSFQSWLHR